MTLRSGLIGGAVVCGFLMSTEVLARCDKPPLSSEFGYSVCKDWPAYPGLSIAALSQLEPRPSSDSSGPDGIYDLDLALVSTDGSKPVATYHRASVFESDAIALEGLQLDTAQYKLTSELRAFGLRVLFKGSSRINPFDQTLLSLYVKDGEMVRPVMDRLVTYQYSGEWDGNCAGERSEVVRTIEIGKTSSHGYADLIVKSVSTATVGEGKGEACQSRSTKAKPVLSTLQYDGKQYVVPEALRGF